MGIRILWLCLAWDLAHSEVAAMLKESSSYLDDIHPTPLLDQAQARETVTDTHQCRPLTFIVYL